MKLKKWGIFFVLLFTLLIMIPTNVRAAENERTMIPSDENELPLIPSGGNSPEEVKLTVPKVKVSVKKSTGKPIISWEKVSDATEYEIQYKVGKEDIYQTLATTANLKVTHKEAVAGKTYYYRVMSIGDGEQYINSDYSKEKSVVCDCAVPTIKVKRTSEGNPVISWKKVSGASKYKIMYKVGSKGKYKTLTTTKKKSYTHKEAVAGKKYYYKVKAINKVTAKGNSAYSSVKSIKAK